MSTITIECPEDVLMSLHETEDQFARELRLAGAVKLYEAGRLSSGCAAQLAGMPRVLFLDQLAQYGVALYQAAPAELDMDVANA